MSNIDSFKIKNTAFGVAQELHTSSAVAAAMKMQESTAYAAALKMQTSRVNALAQESMVALAQEMKRTINATQMPSHNIKAMLEEYHNLVSPIAESLTQLHSAYSPIFEAIKSSEALNIKALVAGIKSSMPAMDTISKMNLTGFAGIVDALPKYDFLSDITFADFTVEEVEQLFEEGEITQQDVNEELVDIITKKKFSPLAEWDKLQKSKWFIAIQLLFCIVNFVFSPVIDYAKDKALDTFGVTEFWNETGIYEYIDAFFDSFNKDTVTEEKDVNGN